MKLLTFIFLLSSSLFAKNYEISLQKGFDYRMATFQIAFSYWIKPNRSIFFKFGSADDVDSFESEKQYNISLGYKVHKGKSFFLIGELAYYAFTEKQSDPLNVNNFFDNEEDYRAISLGARIGNDFPINESFILSFDWVGIGIGTKLASFNEGESASDTPLHYTILNGKLSYRF